MPDNAPEPLACLRCGTIIEFMGTLTPGNRELIAQSTSYEPVGVAKDLYACPRCGHMEFFLPQVGRDLRPCGESGTPQAPVPQAWSCENCGSRVPKNFSVCWNCQAARTIDAEQAQAGELEARRPSDPDWTCPKCRESVPGTFDECWKCRTLRPTLNDSEKP